MFGCNYKVLHFAVKNELRFGYSCKISYFAFKKRMHVPKRPFVSLKQSTKFYSFTQTAICLFTAKYKILHLYPNSHSLFTEKCKNLKTVSKRPFVFRNEIKSLELYTNCHLFFDYEIRNFKSYSETITCFLTTN